MNLLLDTHVALWAIAGSRRLSKSAADLIESHHSAVWISTATVWEIAIKHALGRGDMPVSSRDAARYFRESGFRFLAIEAEHAIAVEQLPAIHHDPFDRMLVAQALYEPMRLITHDPQLALYSDTIIRV